MKSELYLKEKLLCQTERYLFCYNKGFIILRNSSDKSFIQKLCILPFIKSIWLVERMLRYEPRTAVPINNNNFIFTLHGTVYNYSVRNNSIGIEHNFAKGMNNPLTFCVRHDEAGSVFEVLYGEYIWNDDKGPVSIYSRKDGVWREVFTFSAGLIRHIHNIVYDKYKERYIIMTGDDDSESGIWEADLNFKNVKPIASGKQIYRACVCFPQKDCIYYATDTPLEQNKLYKLQETKNGISLTEICSIPGPCIYGTVIGDNLYMATSVEGDPSLSTVRYRLSNKLGKGVTDRFVHIIICSSDGTVREIDKFKKDILPMWLFQFGNVQFPIQNNKNEIYLCPQSTKGKKGTYKIKI